MALVRTPLVQVLVDCKKNKEEDEHLQTEIDSDDEDAESNPLSLLIYKRGQVKAKLTRVRSSLRVDRSQLTLPRLQVMERNLLTYYDEYSRYHNEILDYVDRRGSAAGVIDIKTINDNNYQRAWRLLEDRFENKRSIIDTHIRGLFKLKKMNKESHIQLRDLIEECCRHVDNLDFMEQKVEGISELMIVNLLSDALDTETKKQWEATLEYGELPTYKGTVEFLKKRCQILERVKQSSNSKGSFDKNLAKVHAAATQPETEGYSCHLCNKTHPTFRCEEFRALTIDERLAKVKELRVCFNCLRKGHRLTECKSKKSCMICKSRHNTLLHPDDKANQNLTGSLSHPEVSLDRKAKEMQSSKETTATGSSNPKESTVCSSSIPQSASQVLLMTSVVLVVDKHQRVHPCRAFIDPGSMSHMVSQRMAKLLDLPTKPSFVTVSGINGQRSTANKRMTVEFKSRVSEFHTKINCLVLPKVTSPLPLTNINISSWGIPPNFELADPEFHRTNEVDLLIGCGMFWQLLLPGMLKLADELPELHNSKLGWIVTGEYLERDKYSETAVMHSNATVVSSLDALVRRFWEIEEITGESSATKAEQFCEDHFQMTHRRDVNGRYVVSLPFKENINELGNSRGMAIKRFFMLEKRLNRCQDLRKQYVEFMEKYQRLGHCKEIDESKYSNDLQTYYLPHHAVLRPNSSSTKLRVVFDASAKSSSGKSLNDVLQVGAVVQSDLFSIILGFRSHQFVFTADIIKMYRQVRVRDEDTRYQRVFWRSSPTEPLKTLELTTVTYGTASAPYLATRALKQLAIDERDRYPDAADIVENDFYVDDVLSGADTKAEVICKQMQLKELLSSGGFSIHKWSSNSLEVIENVPENEREKSIEIESVSANDIIKTLGLLWNPTSDEFLFTVPTSDSINPEILTKRLKNKADRLGNLDISVAEMRASMDTIVRVIQQREFADEIYKIRSGQPCKTIANVNPIYVNGLLRYVVLSIDRDPVSKPAIGQTEASGTMSGASSPLTCNRVVIRPWVCRTIVWQPICGKHKQAPTLWDESLLADRTIERGIPTNIRPSERQVVSGTLYGYLLNDFFAYDK
ncbi:uncharacterized protein LOC131433877 [Malaya genurostris]|uniref:uncharacterized protein LOC131433877 n=1 Tax=Malaya genurostris TaxID=325434 RepID=UPI0026F3CDC8|nr:uncharacterized protein LOC131433877 [Malaya genurostris]